MAAVPSDAEATLRLCRIARCDPGEGVQVSRHSLHGERPLTPTLSPQERGEGEEKSKPQHGLADDVALDLVGAAVDRNLAVVEVARRDLRGPIHALVGAGVAVLVGAFIIYNTFSITVAQRTREFAMLRTIGASRCGRRSA